MAKKAKSKAPRVVKPSRVRGGWLHPAAALLLLLAIAWVVATVFATSDSDFPGIGEIPGLFDIGKWNYAIAAAIAFCAMTIADHTRPEPPPKSSQTVGNRWAGPAMIVSAVIGLAWIVVFYVINGTDIDIPVYSDLGQWNIVIGMGFIMAAFGFAMKWE